MPSSETSAVELARECVYRFLSAAFSDPQGDNFLLALDSEARDQASQAMDLLRAEAGETTLGCGELPHEQLDLSPLLDALQQPLAYVQAEYDRIFGLVPSRECPPYETEYHKTSEAFFRSQQLADIAGFYRAFGLEVSRQKPDRPDHIALELEFMAFLLMKKRLAATAEQSEVCAEAERTFFRDHLAWWVPSFATGLRRKAGDGLYAALADVLAALLPTERARLDVPPPRVPLQAVLVERPEEQPDCSACPAGA